METGTGYGWPRPSVMREILVGAGTPTGEWPIEGVSHAS